MDPLIHGREEFGLSPAFRILCRMCCWAWKKILVLVHGLIVSWTKTERKFKSKSTATLDETRIRPRKIQIQSDKRGLQYLNFSDQCNFDSMHDALAFCCIRTLNIVLILQENFLGTYEILFPHQDTIFPNKKPYHLILIRSSSYLHWALL